MFRFFPIGKVPADVGPFSWNIPDREFCTAVYPELSAKMAMKIADASSLEDVTARAWQKFAQNAGIGAPLLRRASGN